MNLDLLPIAKQFFLDHNCNNPGLIHQAMLKGAEIALSQASSLVSKSADHLNRQRERNLKGHHNTP